MKNIITAIGDEEIFNILKEYKELNILYKDIQYEEGIIEAINIEQNAEIIIINNELMVNKKLEEIVQEIIFKNKNIEIIILNFRELENKNLNKIKNIKKIINKDDDLINNLLNYLLEKNENKINYQKKIEDKNILSDEEKEKENNKTNIINQIINKFKKRRVKNIITVLGNPGVGKTIFTGILAKTYAEKGYKVLLIDLDFEFKNLHILFRKKIYPKDIYKKINNEEFINEFKLNVNNLNKLKIKINKNLNLISSADLIFDEKYKINNEAINNLFHNLKEKYDVILIDTGSEYKINIMNSVIENSNKIVYLIENNLLQLKKTKQKLFNIIEEYKLEKRKINIICNKVEGEQNNKNILKFIFKKNKIIGDIKYNKEFNNLINENLKSEIPKKIKKEFKNIINKIENKK